MTWSTPTRRLVLLAAPSLALSACSNIIGPPPSSDMYFLNAPIAGMESKDKDRVLWSLAVGEPNVPESLDSRRIALTKSDTEFDYYANAVWSDRPTSLLQTSLLSGFEATNRIAAVARDEGLVHADFRLVTDIRNFEARYMSPGANPVVVIAIVAHMVDVRSRAVVSSTTAAFTQACSANNLSAVVSAFDIAVSQVVARVVDWALKVPRATEAHVMK